MKKSKPMIKSLGILGAFGSIGTLLALMSQIREFMDNIPPELMEDTRTFLFVTLAATISSLISLIGRWRATVPIKGVLKQQD